MRVLAVIGALAIVAAVAAGVYLFGGFYSVAASKEGNPVVDWALVRVREASMNHHAGGAPPLKLDDPAVIRRCMAIAILTARGHDPGRAAARQMRSKRAPSPRAGRLSGSSSPRRSAS